MTGDRWLSYADAAAALGMTPESVRQRARREHWRKQLGNGGRALILVPADTSRTPPGDTDGDAPVSRPVKRDPTLVALQARLAEMESRTTELRADVERERSERLRERERADRLTDEVASLARQLAQAVGDAGARETELRNAANQSAVEAGKARAELAAWKARPWWRRLAG